VRRKAAGAKYAAIDRSPVPTTVHVGPLTMSQLADHPPNTESGSGAAVSTTVDAGVVFGISAVQLVAPHTSATPAAVSVPLPTPFIATVSGNVDGADSPPPEVGTNANRAANEANACLTGSPSGPARSYTSSEFMAV
jgi:hypothetical protein